METVSRTEAARMTGKDPEGIRRAILRHELTEVELEGGRRGITYESLARYAAERRIGGFFLTSGVMSDGALDDVGPAFWAVIAAKLAVAGILRQIHADARALATAGNVTDARVAHDWAALAEFADIIIPTDPNAPWRVKLPAAGVTIPVPPELAGLVEHNARGAVQSVVPMTVPAEPQP